MRRERTNSGQETEGGGGGVLVSWCVFRRTLFKCVKLLYFFISVIPKVTRGHVFHV